MVSFDRNTRGIPGIPRGRGGFGRGGRGRGGFGNDPTPPGGNRGRGRGGSSQRGGYSPANDVPQGGIGGSAGGPPGGIDQLVTLPPSSEAQYQPKPSRARRIERRKEKNSKGKEKESAPADVGAANDDEIIEIDFNDMGRVFGAISEAPSSNVPAFPEPPIIPSFQAPLQTSVTVPSRGGAPRGRGRGRGGRGGFNAAPLPGQGGYLAQAGQQGGYNHTDFDLQQYAYGAPGQGSSSQSYSRGPGPSMQPAYGQNSRQPQQASMRGAGRGRRGGANFRGFAYDDDDAAGQALRQIARRGMAESNNMYLRPIKFVKSAAVLFQNQEEIFAAEVADNDSTNPGGAAPTANRVEQVFHSGLKPGAGLGDQTKSPSSSSSSSSESDSDEDREEEGTTKKEEQSIPAKDETETAQAQDVQNTRTPPRLTVSTLVEATARLDVGPVPDDDGDDIVLLTPSRPRASVPSDAGTPRPVLVSIQEQIQETEVAVTSEGVEVSQVEVSTEATMDVEPSPGPSTLTQPAAPDTTSDELIASLLQVEEDNKESLAPQTESKMLQMLTGRKRAPKQQRAGGGKRARQAEGKNKGKGKKKEKINWNAKPKFRNDDINWSTPSSEGEGEVKEDESDDGLGGMDVDPDLAGPPHDLQYAAFVNSVIRSVHENQVSAADLEAEATSESESEEDVRVQSKSFKSTARDEYVVEVVEGDEDEDDGWTDTEDEDEVGNVEESEVVISKTAIIGDGVDSEGDEDDDEDDSDDDGDDDELPQAFEWEEEDETEDLIVAIEEFLDENSEVLQGGRRMKKEKRNLYKTLQELVQDDDLIRATMDKKRKKKQKKPDWLPPDLADQWEKDREKKADNKRKRAEARRAAMAAEQLGTKRSKKLKIRLEAMELDSDDDSDIEFELDDRQPRSKKKDKKSKKTKDEPKLPKFDVWKIGRQIHGFVSDRNRETLQLPPMDKTNRRFIHEIASIYKLKSQSSGSGDARATTLKRTGKSSVNVNDRKLDAKLRGWEDALLGGAKGKGKVKGGKGEAGGTGRHREGDIVGEHAAKIGSENVGYQLLQLMGWSEGGRMGVTGGLEAPIHAVFKATKLGLGSI